MCNFLAYFDPGSGSLLVQAIAGGTAGLIVLLRYLWQQAPQRWFRPQSHRESKAT